MKAAALGQFGSGYAWLVSENSGRLSVMKLPNQDCPLSMGLRPLLCLDVWEHAYYLDYQNRRADYVDNWFHRVNWHFVRSGMRGAADRAAMPRPSKYPGGAWLRPGAPVHWMV